ncbi:MAG: trypsin-like peptidase domain-containing protein [Ascidiaceihabitans sp.]|nr:trypsin-like peptidase domain-containing protein [Ascidiaceihabitans sp.]
MRYIFALIASFSFATAALTQEQVPQSQTQIALSFAPLVKQSAPAVVNIYAKLITQARPNTFMEDPFFQRFFDGGTPAPRVQNSLGSGVILSESGIVVSNYHVVGMATDIRVVLNDRREYSARVLLGDEDSDLAILQLEGTDDLPSLDLRASDDVEVGELVLAIGNPFGVGQTVSSGIVSGLARSGSSNGSGRGYFIQTDAPINPGNSGGALIDMAGRLIGINTQILTRSGGSNGIGFAIPADLVGAFVAQAEAGNQEFLRPWAGMSGQSVDADMADTFGLDRPGGIVISGLHPISPFKQAGFAASDVITAVDGQVVNTPSEMVFRMSVAGLGNTSQVTRIRDGIAEDIAVNLVAAPDDPPRNATVLGEDSILPGLQLAQINPAVISEMNLLLQAAGVVITDTGPFGARVGLQGGDVIEKVRGTPTLTPSDVEELLASGGRNVSIVVLRGDSRVQLRFRL